MEPPDPRTQAIIINSPNNPSRRGCTGPADPGGPGPLLEPQGARYSHPIYDRRRAVPGSWYTAGWGCPSFPVYRSTIVCFLTIQVPVLPGERIGYICVPDSVEDHQAVYSAIARRPGPAAMCPPTLIQLTIARCADEAPDLAAYDENRQLLYRELTAMGYQCAKPDGAFYLFVKAPGGDDVAFCERGQAGA